MPVGAVEVWMRSLHARLLTALQDIDGQAFCLDPWQRPTGPAAGEGITAVIENGALFERGGVNFSSVCGDTLPPAATALRPQLAGRSWQAMGVSLVLHPRNPYCPTAHLNVRHFSTHAPGEADIGWFGGGMDLTPYYPESADVRHFHGSCKAALDALDAALYPQFKAACDRYFYLPHRQEARGVGGVFFDDFDQGGHAHAFAVTRAVADAFLPAYLPLLERRRNTPYGARERDFQAYRRARYVEFNLVCDRGTLFGLQSGGRTESILMSLPPVAHWRYDWQPQPGSPEARLYAQFLPAQDWV